jgi:hypothetical protein
MGSPQGGFGQTGIGDSPKISQGPSPIATGASIASMGLSAYSDIMKGKGVQSADNYKAAALEASAQRGHVAAVQTGAKETIALDNTLGMIDSVRAAAHADPTSPTGAAIRDWNETLGLTKKSIDVDNIMAQTKQEESDAAYLRQAGKNALTMGYINAGTDVFSAVSKMGLPF